jgi:hypothetical protein
VYSALFLKPVHYLALNFEHRYTYPSGCDLDFARKCEVIRWHVTLQNTAELNRYNINMNLF